MLAWETIFMDRYKGFDSYADACEQIVAELNKYGTAEVQLDSIDLMNMKSRACIAGGRLYANIKAPAEKRQTSNCFALEVEDTRESWCKVLHDVAMMTLYGGGVGLDYSKLRPNGYSTSTPGQLAGGPCSLIRAMDCMVGELRSCRRGALLAQLNWDHADIDEFMNLKNGKSLPRTNISVQYDEEWHYIIDAGPSNTRYARAVEVFSMNVEKAVTVGEPGIAWNGVPNWNSRKLMNACQELRTATPYDSCNIGGIFPINCNLMDMPVQKSVASTMCKLLLLSTRASVVMTDDAKKVRAMNNSLLIGLGGTFPWMELQKHLGKEEEAKTAMRMTYYYCRQYADYYAKLLGMPSPLDVSGVAPHGTIGLIAGTTGGIEPPYAAAYLKKIRAQDGRLSRPKIAIMVDPTYKRMVDEFGVHCRTAQDLSLTDRLEWQAFNQSMVDMGISSTINLPARGTPGNDMPIDELVQALLKYHRRLVGLTFYPDGAIADQPQVAISYAEAMKYGDNAIVEDTEGLLELTNLACKSGVCGV